MENRFLIPETENKHQKEKGESDDVYFRCKMY